MYIPIFSSLASKPRHTTWDLDKLVKLVQISAIIIGGVWILYEYIDYKRQAGKLGVVLSELNTKSEEQNIDLKKIQLKYADEQQKTLQQQQQLQIELDKVIIRDKENDHKLKAIELQYADQQHKIQQQQARLALDIAAMNINTQRTEGQLKGLELKNAQERNLQYDYSLTLKKKSVDERDNRYLATLFLSLKNTSKSDLEITYIVVEYFSGRPQNNTAPTTVQVLRIVSPPTILDSINPTDTVDRNGLVWSRIGYDAQMIGISRSAMDYDWRIIGDNGRFRYDFENGGSAIGVWKAGEETYFNKYYEIIADSKDYIGFTINVCFNKCRNPVDFWTFPASKSISDAETNNSVAVQAGN